MENIYPPGPQDVPEDLTHPSGKYIRNAWLAMASLSLFIVLYFALASWFTWTAYRTTLEAVLNMDLWYFVIAGCSAFLAVFMWKALFFVQRGSTSDTLEVTASEQPRLFEYLNRLADEAGAPRPARVFLSARVNAAVFYDLSILNFIFPSRKNLEIGMALVNVLTLSEIKAVLAHEFGHFAQSTMAIGSWVYIAHQIAAHIVARRDKLDDMLRSLSHTDPRIAWIGWALSLVVWSIRSLMDTLLSLVLLAQRALSRQMEFQADLVAVSLTGSNELVHALYKLQAADESWDRTIRFANFQVKQSSAPHDLFVVQTRIMEKIALIRNDENFGKVPQVAFANPEKHRVFKSSFAQPPQMWSTHPASADREENAKQRYMQAPHDERSAWMLFDNADTLKEKVTSHLLGNKEEVLTLSAEDTLENLDEYYSSLQYDTRYRGVYLGRSVVRFASRAEDLYQNTEHDANVQTALKKLYGPEVGEDLKRLDELVEERLILEAVRDERYEASSSGIMFRGRQIPRRQLPAAIREVLTEEEEVRQRLLAHDRQCRATHLAAAKKLGGGWHEYLTGLIGVLHYTEHTLADLYDAQALLNNVYAVVTADGRVTSKERVQLIAACNVLHGVMANIYSQAAEVQLEEVLCEWLEANSWADRLGEYKLGSATDDNLADWLNVVDGWVDHIAKPLYMVANNALELLLQAEARVEAHALDGTVPEEPPTASRVPVTYPILKPGQERKKQTKLDLWDRFYTADGFFPGLMRLSVALIFVGGVLYFGSGVATHASLIVYNGLGRDVVVTVGTEQILVKNDMASSKHDVVVGKPLSIETRTIDGEVIEKFEPPRIAHVTNYVYNVAGAIPLVEWTVVYGSATEKPPRFLGAPRWLTTSAEVFFVEPPRSVKTKAGGATRLVLDGTFKEFEKHTSEEARKQIIQAHAKWDTGSHANEWRIKERMLRGVENPYADE